MKIIMWRRDVSPLQHGSTAPTLGVVQPPKTWPSTRRGSRGGRGGRGGFDGSGVGYSSSSSSSYRHSSYKPDHEDTEHVYGPSSSQRGGSHRGGRNAFGSTSWIQARIMPAARAASWREATDRTGASGTNNTTTTGSSSSASDDSTSVSTAAAAAATAVTAQTNDTSTIGFSVAANSAFSASTCVTGGRRSADAHVAQTLQARGLALVRAGLELGSKRMTLLTSGQHSCQSVAGHVPALLRPGATCFSCGYAGHTRRGCPLYAIL